MTKGTRFTLCSMCVGRGKVEGQLGDSLSSDKPSFIHGRWTCMQKEWNQSGELLFRNQLMP